MKFTMTKDRFFKVIIIIWMVLWVFFLVREDKDGQYQTLNSLYRSIGEEKIKVLYGSDMYDFLAYCRGEIPGGSSFEIIGIEEFSIDQVRARYFLWPLINKEGEADFKIVFAVKAPKIPGFRMFREYGGKGYIFARAGGV